MKKLMALAVLAVMLFAGVAQAQERKFFATALDDDWKWVFVAGPAFYHDRDSECLAFFVHTPIARIWRLDVSLGGILPTDRPERTRPEFTLGTHVSEWVDVPSWLNLELSGSAVMSKYRESQAHIVWAVELGLVSVSF